MAEQSVTVKLDVVPGNTSSAKQAFADLGTDLDKAQKKSEGWLGKIGSLIGGKVGNTFKSVGNLFGASGSNLAGGVIFDKTQKSSESWLGKIGSLIGGKIGSPLKSVGNFFGSYSGSSSSGTAIGGLTKNVASVSGQAVGGVGSAAASGASGAISGFGVALGAIAAGAAVATGAVVALTAAIGSFVAKASPVTVERLSIAIDDTMAVIGQSLTPVIEIATDAMRLLGDVFATFLPSANDMRQILSPIKDLIDGVRAAFEVFAPVIELVRDTLVTVAKVISATFKLIINSIMAPIRALQRIGLLPSAGLKSSFGAAARTAKFMDVNSYAKSVYTAAYQAKGGKSKEETSWDKLFGKMDTIIGNLGVKDKPDRGTQRAIMGY